MRWGAEGQSADTGRTSEGTELMLSARMVLPSGMREKACISALLGKAEAPSVVWEHSQLLDPI